MSEKSPSPAAPPRWFKNTYFWIAAILTILGIVGLPFLGGDRAIRDPGQKPENHLALLYFGAAAVMFVNGWMSHRFTVRQYEEENPGPNGSQKESV